MKFEPILKVKIKKFAEDFGYKTLNENALFERYINNLILNMHHPDSTTKNSSLLEMASVGGQNDMGIDGLAIKVNGIIVTSCKEVKDITDTSKQISVEFIFVQSKFKNKIDSGEYSKFADGIYDFLNTKHFEPHNDKIDEWLTLKDYIFSEDIMLFWKDAPVVTAYYVIFGEWREDVHIEGKNNALKEKIYALNDYSDFSCRFLGSSNIARISDDNENSFKIVLNVLGSLEFEEVEDVSNSQVILCKATDFVKLLLTEEGDIRRSLFSDNVRDYQGNTNINEGMLDTIKNTPSSFLLLNNGITIVCSSLISGNRKVTIENPQIVNGCQTSSVIHHAYSTGTDLSNVSLLVKIIATDEGKITNSIVRGTNSQNPVFSESFEITRDFHKNLEDFLIAVQNDTQNDEKIYYERRSKQYSLDPLVKKNRVFSLDMLAHSVISVFLHAPHDGVSHIVNLLEKYRNTIFVDSQSLYPYYCSALLCLNFERLLREEIIERKYDTYKYFLIMMLAERVSKQQLDINNRSIDELCSKIINCCNSPESLAKETIAAIASFEEITNKWINKYGLKYKHGIKDNPAFTQFLLTIMRGGNIDKLEPTTTQEELTSSGVVISAKQDRAGRYYGFIKAFPDNMFFHSEDNPRIDFTRIIGKTVTYQKSTNPVNGKPKAKNVRVVSENA
ncbi:MAG: AIPR family protein [Acutalibacteraceae bacterium]